MQSKLLKIFGIVLTVVIMSSVMTSCRSSHEVCPAYTKLDNVDWQELKPLILSQVMQHYMSGDAIINEIKEEVSLEVSEDDKEIATQIEDLLETRVRPSVASHGGDIVFHSYSEGIVELEMRGACSGCPSSMATLKMGVENMLKHYIPEIMEVKEV